MPTYFPVLANYEAFPQGSTVNGSIEFHPNMPIGSVALVTGASPPFGDIAAPTVGAIVNGNLQTSPISNAPLLLPAQTSDLNLSGTLQYAACFQVTVGTQPIPVARFIFNAQVPRTTTADGAMTNASTTLTSATAAFGAPDVGAVVTVAGAFPAGTIVTIVSVTNSTTVVLSTAATATVSGAALSVCQALDLITVTPASSTLAFGSVSPTTFGTQLVQLANGAALISLLGLGGGQDTYLGATANQAAMLALTGPVGSWTIRTDSTPNTVWYLTGSPASSLGSWTELPVIPSPAVATAGAIAYSMTFGS